MTLIRERGKEKNINRINLIIFLLLGTSLLNGVKLGNVPGIYTPRCMAVYQDNLYVADQASIFIFGLSDMKLKNRFVRKGRGPQEFANTPLFIIHQDEVLVHGSFKVARFDLSGKYISENIAKFYFFNIGIIGEYYVLERSEYDTTKSDEPIYSLGIFDKKYQEIKNLTKVKHIIKKKGKTRVFPLISPIFRFQTFEKKIYMVVNETDFRIKVFNGKGKLEKEIRHEYERIKISEEYKVRRFEFFKNLPGVKKRWKTFKINREFSFPEYFPAIKDFVISEGKIYVNTYLEKDGKEEFRVLSLDGKLEKKVFLPPARRLFRYIWNGHFYYLFENEDEEEWELHSVKIQ